MTNPLPTGRVDSPILLSVTQVARQLNALPMEVYDLCNSGALDSRYQFGRRVILAESVQTYVGSLPTEHGAA